MPSHKIIHLSWWNEGRNHTINSREIPRTSDNLRKKVQLQVRFWPLKQRGPPGPAGLFLKFNYQTKASRINIQNTDPSYPANDQKNIHVKHRW